VGGIATTAAAHEAIMAAPDFQAGEHSTKWVEERLDLSDVSGKPAGDPEPAEDEEPRVKRSVLVEVNGKRFDVAAWVPESAGVAAGPAAAKKPKRAASSGGGAVAGSGQVAVPMQGTIVKVLVEVGQEIEAGQPVVVLEAMKMENNINADKTGTVAEVKVSPGDTVGAGDIVIVIE
jgi:acetyl-CoA/propionyl-CoA carboxylase biotin carboxyl carrier protein